MLELWILTPRDKYHLRYAKPLRPFHIFLNQKKYEATFLYGVKTDTDDASGNALKASFYVPRKNEILDA